MREDYEIKVFYSREDKGWMAVIPELPGCSAFGASPQQAVKELDVAKELWLQAAKREKRNIPEPIAGKKLEGKLLLRLPKDLHRKLVYQAREEGVSLNQWMLYIIARYAQLGPQMARYFAH